MKTVTWVVLVLAVLGGLGYAARKDLAPVVLPIWWRVDPPCERLNDRCAKATQALDLQTSMICLGVTLELGKERTDAACAKVLWFMDEAASKGLKKAMEDVGVGKKQVAVEEERGPVEKRVVVTASAANVRDAPNGNKIAEMRRGDTLTAVGRDGRWVKVRDVMGTHGFIFEDLISEE